MTSTTIPIIPIPISPPPPVPFKKTVDKNLVAKEIEDDLKINDRFRIPILDALDDTKIIGYKKVLPGNYEAINEINKIINNIALREGYDYKDVASSLDPNIIKNVFYPTFVEKKKEKDLDAFSIKVANSVRLAYKADEVKLDPDEEKKLEEYEEIKFDMGDYYNLSRDDFDFVFDANQKLSVNEIENIAQEYVNLIETNKNNLNFDKDLKYFFNDLEGEKNVDPKLKNVLLNITESALKDKLEKMDVNLNSLNYALNPENEFINPKEMQIYLEELVNIVNHHYLNPLAKDKFSKFVYKMVKEIKNDQFKKAFINTSNRIFSEFNNKEISLEKPLVEEKNEILFVGKKIGPGLKNDIEEYKKYINILLTKNVKNLIKTTGNSVLKDVSPLAREQWIGDLSNALRNTVNILKEFQKDPTLDVKLDLKDKIKELEKIEDEYFNPMSGNYKKNLNPGDRYKKINEMKDEIKIVMDYLNKISLAKDFKLIPKRTKHPLLDSEETRKELEEIRNRGKTLYDGLSDFQKGLEKKSKKSKLIIPNETTHISEHVILHTNTDRGLKEIIITHGATLDDIMILMATIMPFRGIILYGNKILLRYNEKFNPEKFYNVIRKLLNENNENLRLILKVNPIASHVFGGTFAKIIKDKRNMLNRGFVLK